MLQQMVIQQEYLIDENKLIKHASSASSLGSYKWTNKTVKIINKYLEITWIPLRKMSVILTWTLIMCWYVFNSFWSKSYVTYVFSFYIFGVNRRKFILWMLIHWNLYLEIEMKKHTNSSLNKKYILHILH